MRISEPAHAGAGGGGQFGGHTRRGEPHGVVAGHAHLVIVVGDPLRGVPGLRADRAGGRQHRDITERRAAHRGVRHAETGDLVLAVVVARVCVDGVRRVLHHPERHRGAGEVVDLPHRPATLPGPDERVDVTDRVRD